MYDRSRVDIAEHYHMFLFISRICLVYRIHVYYSTNARRQASPAAAPARSALPSLPEPPRSATCVVLSISCRCHPTSPARLERAAGAMAPPTGKKASLATAKAVPTFLVLVVAYASYVVVGPLSIDYLLNPPENVPPRIAAGIAIPIVWVVLLCPVAFSWLRLLIVVFRDPGYMPLGEERDRHEPPPEIWMRDVFVCDRQGLPIYCQHCQNWKPDRAHHSQDAGRCTLKMDHFCPW